MKKFIALLLALTMCLGLFAACDTAQPAATSNGLEDAKTYLEAMYKDEAEITAVDYSRVSLVMIDGVKYTVTWTSDKDSIKITAGDTFTSIELPDTLEDIAYTLTATIADANGNTVTASFSRKVPASAGLPTEIADGTYVILAGNLTMSSLDQSKGYGYPTANEVTVSGNSVSNHFKADVLTIKNVEGGVTIQDAYGRYFYLKGTYNSFNVDATMPAEGAVWEVLKNGDDYIIVNATNGKTLAYSTSYSSWGAYPEITDDYTTLLAIVPATAPAEDPSTPDAPETPDTPETPDAPAANEVTAPVAGTAYKLALIHGGKGNSVLYFTGEEKPNYPWYMLSSTSEADAIDVYVEEVDGGLLLYFYVGETKTYLDMHKDGTHYSLQLTTEPVSVYTWNTEYNTFVTLVDDKDCFIGTSGTYDTFSCNKMEYVSSSYVAHLYTEGTIGGETPDAPAEGGTLTVEQAIAMGAAKEHNTYTEEKYYVTGVITEIYNETYGNMKITDENGNILTIYGTYSADGEVRFDAMETKPVVGDTVTIYGIVGQYNDTPQIKNGWIVKIGADEATGDTLTIEQAIAMGAAKEHNTYTEEKYYVTGVITEVYNETYGNMKITDGNGNILTIYGTYSADGSTRYDAMDVKPVVGDTVTIYGIVGQYNDAPQIKNGWITAHTPGEGGGATEEPTTPAIPESDADAAIYFNDAANRTVMTEAQQVWVQNGITVTNDVGESTQPVKDYTNPVRFYAKTNIKIECAGMKVIKVTCNNESYATALNDAITGATVSVEGNVVTITLDAAADSFEIIGLAKQVRVDSIEIYK